MAVWQDMLNLNRFGHHKAWQKSARASTAEYYSDQTPPGVLDLSKTV